MPINERSLRRFVAGTAMLGVAAAGFSESKPSEAFRGRRAAIVSTIPESTTTTVVVPRENIVFPRPTSVEMPTILPIEVPTATEIRKFLPKSLHPEFLYENDDQKKKDIPSFVTISPLILNGIVGSEPAYVDGWDEVGEIGQGFLEFRTVQKNPVLIRLSFSDYRHDDLDPLVLFQKNNPPNTHFRLMMPVSPGEAFRFATIVGHEQSLDLTPTEAAMSEKQALEVGAWALAGGNGATGDLYFLTKSTDYIRPVR